MLDEFEKEVKETLEELGFEVYESKKEINVEKLKTSYQSPNKIEIDLIAILKGVGFLIEVTTQQKKINKK